MPVSDRVECIEPGCEAMVRVDRRKTGRCRRCANVLKMARLNSDPAIKAKRSASCAKWTPEQRHARAARLNNRPLSAEEVERRSEHGRQMARILLSDPEIIARRAANAKKAGETRTNRVLGWCPPELRDAYRKLCGQKIKAARAREIIEEGIPGTAAHARRLVRNTIDAMRIKEGLRWLDGP